MRYPHFLPEGGTIAFAAPSFGCAAEPYRTAFDHAQEVLRGRGHSLVLGPGCYAAEGIGISRAPKACGQEINELYTSGESDVLISCGGGELMCEILDYVDFDAIRAAQAKWFMGFSDNTNLTFLLPTLCDTASIYGPCAGAFGMEPWHPAVQDAYDLLRGRLGTQEGRSAFSKEEVLTAGALNVGPSNGGQTDAGQSGSGSLRRYVVHNYPAWEREGDKSEDNPLAPYHCTEPVRIKVFRPEAGCPASSPEPSVTWDSLTGAAASAGADCSCGEAVKMVTDAVTADDAADVVCSSDRAAVQSTEGTSNTLRFSDDAGEIRFSGRLIGGCLDCLVNLTGTMYDRAADFSERYAEDGIVWFLEACDLNVFAIRRAVWELKHAGWFSHVKGFLIGRPLCFGQEMMGLDQYQAVVDVLKDLQVPIIMDVDLGHLPPMMPLICGSLADVTCTPVQEEAGGGPTYDLEIGMRLA